MRQGKTPTRQSAKTSGELESYWIKSVSPILFSKLKEDLQVDVVVVGAGIAGMSVAYFLAKAGKNVAVVEDGAVGSGETGRTTAHLAPALDDRYYELEKLHGKDGAALAAESHYAAVDTIEKIIKSEKIDCDFTRLDGYLFLHPSDKPDSLEDELKATRRAGIKTQMVRAAPISSFDTGPAVKFPNQGQFHPMKYLQGLAQSVLHNGGQIYTETHADEISADGVVTSEGKRISANHVVVCTNTPVNDKVRMHTKQAPYRTYVIASKIPKGSVPTALFWDTGDQTAPRMTFPYHYIRIQPIDSKSDLLIVGGEDHKAGQTEHQRRHFENLEIWVRERFPMVEKIDYKWSGHIMEPIDSLAFIGKNPMSENIYIATGDSGNGMTHGTIAGMIISDLILGRKNKWIDLYDPSRKRALLTTDFITENLNFIKQYKDWITAGDKEDPKKMPKEEGAVIRKGLKLLTVFKDEKGKLHFNSAVCPHLGCAVRWNKIEKTFDCPCHGSRFSGKGKVINGPANTDLKKAEW